MPNARRPMKDAIAADAMQSAATSPVWARFLTSPLSLLYRAAVALRSSSFEGGLREPQQLPGITIAIGNVVAGGAGKSPLTAAIAAFLTARGQKTAILTRGWGANLAKGDSIAYLDGRVLMAPLSGAADVRADEPIMMSKALPTVPVVCGADRQRAALRFLAAHRDQAPVYWLLDDGFQHRQLARDFDIVVVDAVAPFGNGRMLPRGPLREPPSALRRADLLIYARAGRAGPDGNAVQQVRRHYSGPTLAAPFGIGPLEPVAGGPPFDAKRHGKVLAVCGIARPDRFLSQVRSDISLGLEVVGTYVVGDHEPIRRDELVGRVAGAGAIITTAKDYWRDPTVFAGLAIPVFVQPIVVELTTEALTEALRPVLA